MGTAMAVWSLAEHERPYTVDDLFELPPEWDDIRCEVVDGNLIVSPAPGTRHQVIGDRLCRLFDDALPIGVDVITAVAVRMPGGDGLIPDVVVTTGDFLENERGFRAEDVHTVVEVVSPSNAKYDRVTKRDLYAEVGIPCYWLVETDPVIVVRLGERTIMAPAGREHELPLATGRGPADVITVRLDPAALVTRRSARSG